MVKSTSDKTPLLDDLLKQKTGAGFGFMQKTAISWLAKKVGQMKNVSRQQLIMDFKRLRTAHYTGRMYFFYYDPKTKEKLPYYDRFPLVIPIQNYSDGFLGLNLHYLEPRTRARFLDKLSGTLNNTVFDNTTKFRLTYDLLNGVTRYREFIPCLKRYLFAHVQSRFVFIEPAEWQIAIFLPVESFVGASKQTVWSESRTRYRNK